MHIILEQILKLENVDYFRMEGVVASSLEARDHVWQPMDI
jgi:hypothetical protein